MKNLKTILSMIIVGCCAFIPMMIVDAAEIKVTDETTLTNAVSTATTGDVIVLENDINLTKAIIVEGKEITIDGNGYSIIGTRELIGGVHDNITLITAQLDSAVIHFENITLKNSPKYGVQAYDGGYISLNNVTIENCKYGAALANAGTIEVINLTVNGNGEEDKKGIEISKGPSASADNHPKVIMNGTINASNTDYVVFFAKDDNDNTTQAVFENTDATTDKILVNGTTAVITDANNEVKYTSNEMKETTTSEGEEYIPNIDVTDPVDPETPTDEVKGEENPETSDGIALFLGLTIVGFAGVALTYRRLHN